MRITLVAAVSENNVIGRDGGLPWRLPRDLRRFKQLTTGHTVVMGRRTWESLRKPLPDRTNIVLTSRRDYTAPGAMVLHTLDDAIELARRKGETELMVIGGASVYAEALPRADRLDLTLVHANVEGDTRFPAWDPARWNLAHEEHHPADDENEHATTFRVYERAADQS